MTTTVEIELEVESGLTNSAVESTFADLFEEDNLVSINAFDTPELFQDPIAGDIVNTEWADPEMFIVDVEKDGEAFREYYAFDSVEELNEVI